MNQEKECLASPELRIFFENILTLKSDIKKYREFDHSPSLKEIYNRLDRIMKETQ